MNAYYKATQRIKDLLLADIDVNTVTKGDFTQWDLNKKNIYPMARLNVYSAGFTTSTLEFDIVVMVADLRDTRKEQITDKFIGNDNEDDNFNTTLYVLLRLYLQLEKIDDDFTIVGFERPEPFTEARNNIVDGWMWRFTVEIPIENIGAC